MIYESPDKGKTVTARESYVSIPDENTVVRTGKLHHTKSGWTITYVTSDLQPHGGRWVRVAEINLHPDDISLVQQTYVDDEYRTVYIHDGKNVEFEIVGECGKLVKA